MSERREPPYKRRPTESLFLSNTSPKLSLLKDSVNHSVSTNDNNKVMIKRELDEETGKKILNYVYQKRGGLLTIGGGGGMYNNNNNRPKQNLTKTGHKQDFYVHSSSSQQQQQQHGGLKTLVDTVSDSLNITTSSNIQKIDIHFLVNHGITLEILIDDIGVKISEMYAGGVLMNFRDLITIGFQPLDLVRDRKLFNCDMLGNLYNVNYETFSVNGISFDIRDIIRGEFLASELHALEYNIDLPISKEHLGLPILKALNFSLEGLTLIGFTKEHLKKLKIGAREARELGWNHDEYLVLCGGPL